MRQRAKAIRLGAGATGFDLGSATSLAGVLEGLTQPLPTLTLPSAEWIESRRLLTAVCLFAGSTLLARSLAVFFHSFQRLLRLAGV